LSRFGGVGAVYSMYHCGVQRLEQSVLSFIRARQMLRPGDRVGVAVSGGADSLALLRILLALRHRLGVVLAVVHLNHHIRGAAADEDASFVARLAAEHDLQLHLSDVDAPEFARLERLGLEAAGRTLRYRFFAGLLRHGKLTRVATAHTADDQAETVLLRLMRGAGTRGLAGIQPERSAQPDSTASGIIRPLLGARRTEIEQYLRDIYQGTVQPWREDASNRDMSFARNRVRHQLLPLLERQYNPSIVRVLSAAAEAARAEEQYWAGEISRTLPAVLSGKNKDSLDVALLLAQPLALQRRMVRALAEAQGVQLDFEHVERVLALAAETYGSLERVLELPGMLRVRNIERELRFERESAGAGRQPNASSKTPTWPTYQYGLKVPGEVEIRELGRRIRAFLLPGGDCEPGYNREQFLDPLSLAPELLVRNWRPGDRFWPAHTKAPRKLKELLQERRILRPDRALWPVVVSGDEIVWVAGFAAAKPHCASADGDAEVLVIEDLPVMER
jgi:tRNA(Ile)-lysidine synthase